MFRHIGKVGLMVVVLGTSCLAGDIFGGGDRSQLDENREKWTDAAIASYTYQVDRSCFCGFFGPAVITVVDHRIVSVRQFFPDTVDIQPAQFNFFDTVEDLFGIVANAIEQDAHKLEVTYDERYGFPSRISIDYIENAIDDEIVLTVSGFTPVEGS